MSEEHFTHSTGSSPCYPGFDFSVDKTLHESKAQKDRGSRLGKLTTPHGVVETPNFIFCATKAAIKGVESHELPELGTQIILSNTYHLMLQPGADAVSERGGLHKFMNWNGPMLTDSGGYQIFAMGFESVSKEIKRNSEQSFKKTLLSLTPEGATFRSYLDGRKIFLSPEIAITVQRKLGADLIVQLDECTPFNIDKLATEKSMRLSLAWGERSLRAFKKSPAIHSPQALYGVVQGGVYPDLRAESASGVMNTGFFGVAIGGSLGQNPTQMYEVVGLTAALIYEGGTRANERQEGNSEGGSNRIEKTPIHLLGIGKIRDIFYGVRQGIDTFDCVHPTRMARHGWAIIPAQVKVRYGVGGERGGELQSTLSSRNPDEIMTRINLNNAGCRTQDIPLDPSLAFEVSRGVEYTRAYLHHLLKAKEINALTILARHNVLQMNRLMVDIRKGIEEGNLDEVERFWCEG